MKQKQIFIVDDDVSVRKALKRFLSSYNFDVSVFDTVEGFLDAVCSDTSGCLVLDVHMPGTNGLELQRKLQAAKAKIKTIFITADRSIFTRENAAEAGAFAYLFKPFTQQEFMRLIRSAFSGQKISRSHKRIKRAERTME